MTPAESVVRDMERRGWTARATMLAGDVGVVICDRDGNTVGYGRTIREAWDDARVYGLRETA